MPQLSDLVEKKKFVKKSFRPWDLSGSGTPDTSSSEAKITDQTTAEIAHQKTITIQNIPTLKENVRIDPPITTHTDTKLKSLIDNKTGNNEVTTRVQANNNQVTLLKQPDINEITSRQQLGNDLDNNTGNVETIRYLTDTIKKLTGIQKDIFLYIIQICSARGALDTGNILSSDLGYVANCTTGSAKTSLNRLVWKKIVIRHEGKACKGGYMVLGITNEIQAAAIQAQQLLFNPLKHINTDNKTGNVSGNNPYSSSSSLNINKTTTSLPEEWKFIDFEPLHQIGFSETQLRQLFESKSSVPEIVQESIYHFAFALQHSPKTKAYQDPLNIFMGVLRKGNRWHEPHYVSPKELALRQILDEKRKRKKEFDSMIKELVDMEFPKWRKQLTDEDVKQIVPESILKMNMTAPTLSALRTHFIENILKPSFEK